MSPEDAEARGLADGAHGGGVERAGGGGLRPRSPTGCRPGMAVAEGVFWARSRSGGQGMVNALTSQRLTDEAGGSTFYDNRVDVRAGRRVGPAAPRRIALPRRRCVAERASAASTRRATPGTLTRPRRMGYKAVLPSAGATRRAERPRRSTGVNATARLSEERPGTNHRQEISA